MPEEARRRSSAVSADGRYLSLGSGSAAPVVVEVQHSALVEYPLEGEVAKRRAAVERYKAESLAHRQAIFDWNGKILDLIADGVLHQEEAHLLHLLVKHQLELLHPLQQPRQDLHSY